MKHFDASLAIKCHDLKIIIHIKSVENDLITKLHYRHIPFAL